MLAWILVALWGCTAAYAKFNFSFSEPTECGTFEVTWTGECSILMSTIRSDRADNGLLGGTAPYQVYMVPVG